LIEIDVRERRKQGCARKSVYFPVDYPGFPRFHGEKRKPLEGINQQVLEIGDLGLLAANADFVASLALCRLFTLITKHRFAS
jgi:hypothetical protein